MKFEIGPAPNKLEPPFSCMLCDNKVLKNTNAVKYHIRYHHKLLGLRERSQMKELILYGKLKYSEIDYEDSEEN
jgi:hypothetical protein